MEIFFEFDGEKVFIPASTAGSVAIYSIFRLCGILSRLTATAPSKEGAFSVGTRHFYETNNREPVYDNDDHHYRVNFKGVLTIDVGFETVTAATKLTDTGFTALFTVPFTAIQPEAGMKLGFDMRYNDAAPDGVRRLVNFADASDTGWNDPSVFGLLELTKGALYGLQ